jgi:hypothetical protein
MIIAKPCLNCCGNSFIIIRHVLNAVVAQAVEHFLGKEEVPGSSPGNSSTYLSFGKRKVSQRKSIRALSFDGARYFYVRIKVCIFGGSTGHAKEPVNKAFAGFFSSRIFA